VKRYVVRADRTVPARDGGTVEMSHYWYGPDHGWGTTSGARADYAVATFPSRLAAENALRKVYGTVAEAKRQGYKVVPE
jgi:hypothetical protein